MQWHEISVSVKQFLVTIVSVCLRDALHSAIYAIVRCPSVTRRYCIETYKDIIKLFYQPGSATSLVFHCYIWMRNSNGKGNLSLGWIFSV